MHRLMLCFISSRVTSVELFEHFVPDKKHPVWVSWVTHVHYFKLLMKDSYTMPELIELDKAVYDAAVAFDNVPQYKGYFKPKQHFASHASINILRMGPMSE